MKTFMVSSQAATELGWDDVYQPQDSDSPTYAEIRRAFANAEQVICGRTFSRKITCSEDAIEEFLRWAEDQIEVLRFNEFGGPLPPDRVSGIRSLRRAKKSAVNALWDGFLDRISGSHVERQP
jgi:hypothetical protein